MVIRSFGIRDINLVRRLQGSGMALDLEGRLVRPHSPLQAALVGWLPFVGVGAATYVLDGFVENGQLVQGFAQARERQGHLEADVVYLAASPSQPDGVPQACQHLLAYLCHDQGAQGIQRLYAKVAEDAEEMLTVFRQAGFVVYALESLLRLDTLPEGLPSAADIPLRPRQSADSWGLQRLYFKSAPRTVQQAECAAGGSWESSPVDRLRGERDERWVWEQAGEILGYVRLVQGRQGNWLKVLLHPQAQDRADDLVGWALALLADFAPRPTYTTVRAYEVVLQAAFSEANFRHLGNFILLVKHTTARVREPEWKRATVLDPGVEAAPTVSSQYSKIVSP